MNRHRFRLILAGIAAPGALLGGACVFGGDDDGSLLPTATNTQESADPTNTAASTEVVAGATTSTASATPSEQTHTVEAGQSLGTIASLYGTTVQALVEANEIADPNLIYPGQVLIIPEATAAQ